MDLVRDVCVRYLQQLKLSSWQLVKLARLWDKLHNQEACTSALKQLVQKPWSVAVVQQIPHMVSWLLVTA